VIPETWEYYLSYDPYLSHLKQFLKMTYWFTELPHCTVLEQMQYWVNNRMSCSKRILVFI